jgi:hypothetical protein
MMLGYGGTYGGDEARGVETLGQGERCRSEDDRNSAPDDGPDDPETTPERMVEERCSCPVNDGHGVVQKAR